MHAIVTRPQPEAQRWVDQLVALGCPASALPLLEIRPAASQEALESQRLALAVLPACHAVMFVSGNAVQHFFRLLPPGQPRLPVGLRAWAPGPGTAATLQQHGVPPDQIDQPDAHAAQFDSEALWEVVQTQLCAGQQVLIVRGADNQQQPHHEGQGRAWLAQQLQLRGITPHFAVVYERHPPVASTTVRHAVQQRHATPSAWLFSSSECLRNLQTLLPAADWQAHTALCTHPRIAQRARSAGFGCVIDTKPSVHAIAASIKSLP